MRLDRNVVVLAMVAVAFGGVRVVQAQDAKAMAGGSCLPLLSSSSTYNPWTRIRIYASNGHNAALTYVCAAMPRDNETSARGLATATVAVQVPVGQTMSCTLRSATEYNVQRDVHVVSYTNERASAANARLSFGSHVNVSIDNGTYGLSCRVPSGGRIYSYRWAENAA